MEVLRDRVVRHPTLAVLTVVVLLRLPGLGRPAPTEYIAPAEVGHPAATGPTL